MHMYTYMYLYVCTHTLSLALFLSHTYIYSPTQYSNALTHPRTRPLTHKHISACHALPGSNFFGSGSIGGGGGCWGGRSNVGGGSGGDKPRGGNGREKLMQGLLAMRGGECWLSAQAQSQRARCPATNALLCINVVVYVLQLLTQGWLLNAGAKVNSMIVRGQYYRLLTPMFLHGGLVHLLCNCLSLNAVGPMVEMLFGTERMVFTYVLAGLGGNLFSFRFSQAMSVGASGAIFGLVGALGVYLLRHRELYGERSDRMLTAIMQTCLLNVCIGLIPGMRIDNWGHLGGAVAGAAVGYLFGPNLIKTGWGGVVDKPLIALPSLR